MTLKGFTKLCSAALVLATMAAAPTAAQAYLSRLEPIGVGGCRTKGGEHGTYKVFKNVTLQSCAKKCFGPETCEGVEYNQQKKSCEVHWQPISKVKYVAG